MSYSVFIDGAVGTTGLEIVERLSVRDEFALILLDEDRRKDASARADAFHAAEPEKRGLWERVTGWGGITGFGGLN